jgi:hypothetical protein
VSRDYLPASRKGATNQTGITQAELDETSWCAIAMDVHWRVFAQFALDVENLFRLA